MTVHAWLLLPVIVVSWLCGFAARGLMSAPCQVSRTGFIDADELRRRSIAADRAMERLDAAARRHSLYSPKRTS